MARDRLSPNHEEKEAERISALSNRELLEEALEVGSGFTRDGVTTHRILTDELNLRLAQWMGPKPNPKFGSKP